MMAQNRNSITWFVRVNRKDQLIFYNRGLDCSISRERKPPGFNRQKKELKLDLLTKSKTVPTKTEIEN